MERKWELIVRTNTGEGKKTEEGNGKLFRWREKNRTKEKRIKVGERSSSKNSRNLKIKIVKKRETSITKEI